MQLIPSRTFTIVRQLNNPAITDTFYVRAVLRNAYSDTILDTLNLTDKGGQRFKKDWIVPPDPLGLGMYVSIVTSVYTDSGYTTKSDIYGDEEETYLLANLPRQATGGGGVDYRAMRSMMAEEIAKIPKVEIPDVPEQKEPVMRWGEVMNALDEVKSLLQAIPTKQADLSPIVSKIEQAMQAIEAKEVTPSTDLSPVLSAINETKSGVDMNHEEMKQLLDEAGKASDVVGAVEDKVRELFDQTNFVTSFSTHAAVGGDFTPKHKKMIQDNFKQANEPKPQEPDHAAIANSLAQ